MDLRQHKNQYFFTMKSQQTVSGSLNCYNNLLGIFSSAQDETMPCMIFMVYCKFCWRNSVNSSSMLSVIL